VEERLAETRADLERASTELRRFQNEHKTVALDAQIAALIRNAAELKAQITADEIELSVLQGSRSQEHPTVRRLKSRIRETQRRLDMLQTSPSGDTTVALFGSGLEGVPRLVQELAVITRKLTIAENLFTLLTERYETARIQEQRDTPSFSVLDRAAGGGSKVRPMRALIGLATLLASFGVAVAMILVRAYWQELSVQDPARYRALEELGAAFRRRPRRDRHSGDPS
jgi:capsule polysaccharide export protein KpsE/RkpR